MKNQPLPYPPRARPHVTVAHSWGKTLAWVAFTALVSLTAIFWCYFWHYSWIGDHVLG